MRVPGLYIMNYTIIGTGKAGPLDGGIDLTGMESVIDVMLLRWQRKNLGSSWQQLHSISSFAQKDSFFSLRWMRTSWVIARGECGGTIGVSSFS